MAEEWCVDIAVQHVHATVVICPREDAERFAVFMESEDGPVKNSVRSTVKHERKKAYDA